MLPKLFLRKRSKKTKQNVETQCVKFGLTPDDLTSWCGIKDHVFGCGIWGILTLNCDIVGLLSIIKGKT